LEDASELPHTEPHEAIVGPGDILFLPPLWPHTASHLGEASVAVNVFFKGFESGYSTGRDVYGNRDMAAYENGRRDIAKIARGFAVLPSDVKDFYLRRLADELIELSRSQSLTPGG
jgi:tRNA wybutosine-synthesizing protein 4